jgi:ABC-2 type transport system permease protein
VRWIYTNNDTIFQHIGIPLLGIFPFISMFLVSSVTMLRERSTGTLERLMTMPVHKTDLLFGYAAAFASIAVVQATLTSCVAIALLGLTVKGSAIGVVVLAVLNAILGMSLGLFMSAFARSEFQAVQFFPAIVLPQLLLCGLFAPRDQMATLLHWFSDILPMTYAYDALIRLSTLASWSTDLTKDLSIIVGVTILALVLGAATLPRRTA